MGHSLPDYELTSEWTDLTTLPEYSDIVDTLITVQAKFVTHVFVYVGGTAVPDAEDGHLLLTGVGLSQTSDHWWVKGKGRLSILVEGSILN